MKKVLPWKLIALCMAVAMLGFACGGDDDDDDGDDGGGAASPGAQSLAIGNVTVPAGGSVQPTTVTAPADGRIITVMDWDEPGNMTAYFKQSGPANFGWVQGGSPLTSTIDNAESNKTYTFYMVNGVATNFNVSYTISFDPSS